MEKQLSALNKEMSTLDKIGKVLGDVRPGDVIIAATLSPEARQVYSYLLSGLEQGNKEVQKSARAAALVAARMTDRLVSFHREAGEAGYTAMDALPELLTNAGQETQEKEAAQRFAQAVESQKEAVRRQYEGTEMWMKAPNGQPTNLTEDQWLAVRAPAFKAWFGDWEAAAAVREIHDLVPAEIILTGKPSTKRILHSTGISDIRIYQENKKGASSQRIRVSDPGEERKPSFIDYRLAKFFDSANNVSKVVDENGEPLMVYHGTTGGCFAVFDRRYGTVENDWATAFILQISLTIHQ